MVSYKALNTYTKRILGYSYYTTWNCNVLEEFTTVKNSSSNISYTIWNIDASKIVTNPKSIISNYFYSLYN